MLQKSNAGIASWILPWTTLSNLSSGLYSNTVCPLKIYLITSDFVTFLLPTLSFVLRTGLEPVIFTVKGWRLNRFVQRSVCFTKIQPIFQRTKKTPNFISVVQGLYINSSGITYLLHDRTTKHSFIPTNFLLMTKTYMLHCSVHVIIISVKIWKILYLSIN